MKQSTMAEAKKPKQQTNKHINKQAPKSLKHETTQPQETPWSSKGSLTSFFTCKHYQTTTTEGNINKSRRNGCSGSICKLRDMQRPETTPAEQCKRRASANVCNAAERTKKKPLSEINGVVVSKSLSSRSSVSVTPSTSSSSVISGSFRGMQFKRLSGCYECHNSVIDPISGVLRDSSLRATICPCPDCGQIFMKPENLEIHQAVRHAVSELSLEDSSRNIVEIIFQSSWLKRQEPHCKIDRILKVHNLQKTINRFEDYRDSIKSKTSKLGKKHPRCNADGNELLRFHCTTFKCSLGLNGTTNLCNSIPHCDLCSIIRYGFKTDSRGRIETMATSGRAHDAAKMLADIDHCMAMLVCRVIAGKVKRNQEALEECDYDSVVGTTTGIYSNLDELFVFNPRAILPCFVVIFQC